MKVGIAGLEDVKREKQRLNQFIRESKTIQEQELDNLVASALPEMLAKTPYKSGKLESGVYCRRSNSARNRGVVAGAVAMHKRYNYAMIQHENEYYNHPIKGEAHFISEPLRKAVDAFIIRVRERMRQAW